MARASGGGAAALAVRVGSSNSFRSAASSSEPGSPPSSTHRCCASAPRRSSSSSEWSGSWWKSTVRSAPVRRAKLSACEVAEWPQPTWLGYSASVYWPSWISSEVSRARAKPEIQSSSSCVEVGAEGRLVVGDVGERGVAVVDPVAEGGPAVGDRGGADPGRADLPLALRAVAEGDVAGQLADLDRGERRGDVAGDAVAQRGLGRGRPPDHDLGLGAEGGGEEDEALDVVEVEVGEEDVQPGRLVGQGEAEAADPGAGVERQHRAVGEGDADAGGVAAVADRFRPRGRDRPPRSPELDLHAGPAPLPSAAGQKTAIAPCEPCAVWIGKAETSTSCWVPSVERTVSSAWAGRPPRTAVTSGSSS